MMLHLKGDDARSGDARFPDTTSSDVAGVWTFLVFPPLVFQRKIPKGFRLYQGAYRLPW